MIQHPAILALTAASTTTALMLVYAGLHAIRIFRKWDPRSGSETQLELERRTSMISVLVGTALLFEAASLFLFIFAADNLHRLFTGAMCAAGTLGVNQYGYPVLLLRVFNCLLAGVWLILNYADSRGCDFPLIRVKYGLLGVLAPLVLLEALLQFLYFINLKADVITSCCGSLFSPERPGVGGGIAALPNLPVQAVFFGAMAATLAGGALFLARGKGSRLFAGLSALAFLAASAGLVSFIGMYFYELPTHRCPFCILQKEYGYIGYVLYLSLLVGVVSGLGVGILEPYSSRASLSRAIPVLQRRLAAMTMALYLLFTVIVIWRIVSTSFRLENGP